MLRAGKVRGAKVKYKDGVGCCIWEPMKDTESEEDEGSGICFDFGAEDLPDMLKMIKMLIEAEPIEYVPDPDYEKFEEKQKEKEKKWWYKLYEAVEDIGISFTLFDWRIRKLLVTRVIPASKKSSELVHKMCKGFCFGPFTITW